MITIRKAIANDKSKIQEMINNESINQLNFAELPEHTMVVELDNTLVGWGYLDICDNLAFIRFVYIDPDHRNQSLGDGLIRALINYADRRNVKTIYVSSDDEKIDYFKRFGFKYITCDQGDKKIYETFNLSIKDLFIMELDVDEFFNSCHCH